MMEKNNVELNIGVEWYADFFFPNCLVPEQEQEQEQQQPRDVVIEQDLNLHRVVRRLPFHTDIPIHTFMRRIMEEAEAESEKRRKEAEEEKKRYEEEKEEKKKRKEEEEKKKKEEEGEWEDIISNLPDNLLMKILSYLPINQQARSRILSHRWNSQLWASNPLLRISYFDRLLCCVQYMCNLKIIHLDNLKLKKDQMDALLSDASSPHLETLMIHRCMFQYGPVYLSHPTINKIHLTSCSLCSLHEFFVLELPKLESLQFMYSYEPLLLLQPATYLVEASLHGYHNHLRVKESYFHLMRSIPHLRRLTITFEMFHQLVVGDSEHSKYSFKDLEELFVGEFENLEELHLDNGTVTDAFCVALVTFINGNPSIQKLCLKADVATRTSWDHYGHYYGLDDCYPYLDTSPPFPNRQPFPLLLQLKRFRIIGSKGKWGEIRLTRLILKHAVALESFNVICCCRDKDGIRLLPYNNNEDPLPAWQMHRNPPGIEKYSCYWERLQAEMDENIIHKMHSDCQKGSPEAVVPVTVAHRNIICPLHYNNMIELLEW